MRLIIRSLSYLFLLLTVQAGCGGPSADLIAPRLRVPEPNYACSNNPPFPPALFRVIWSPDGIGADTTSSFLNRYLVPHRSKDTVWTTSNQGARLALIFGSGSDSSHVCITLFDSLTHHLPNVRGAVEG